MKKSRIVKIIKEEINKVLKEQRGFDAAFDDLDDEMETYDRDRQRTAAARPAPVKKAQAPVKKAQAPVKKAQAPVKKTKKAPQPAKKPARKPREIVQTTSATFTNYPLVLQQAAVGFRMDPTSKSAMAELKKAAIGAVKSGQIEKSVVMKVFKIATDTNNDNPIKDINAALGLK